MEEDSFDEEDLAPVRFVPLIPGTGIGPRFALSPNRDAQVAALSASARWRSLSLEKAPFRGRHRAAEDPMSLITLSHHDPLRTRRSSPNCAKTSAACGMTKPLVVTDKGVVASGLLAKLEAVMGWSRARHLRRGWIPIPPKRRRWRRSRSIARRAATG